MERWDGKNGEEGSEETPFFLPDVDELISDDYRDSRAESNSIWGAPIIGGPMNAHINNEANERKRRIANDWLRLVQELGYLECLPSILDALEICKATDSEMMDVNLAELSFALGGTDCPDYMRKHIVRKLHHLRNPGLGLGASDVENVPIQNYFPPLQPGNSPISFSGVMRPPPGLSPPTVDPDRLHQPQNLGSVASSAQSLGLREPEGQMHGNPPSLIEMSTRIFTSQEDPSATRSDSGHFTLTLDTEEIVSKNFPTDMISPSSTSAELNGEEERDDIKSESSEHCHEKQDIKAFTPSASTDSSKVVLNPNGAENPASQPQISEYTSPLAFPKRSANSVKTKSSFVEMSSLSEKTNTTNDIGSQPGVALVHDLHRSSKFNQSQASRPFEATKPTLSPKQEMKSSASKYTSSSKRETKSPASKSPSSPKHEMKKPASAVPEVSCSQPDKHVEDTSPLTEEIHSNLDMHLEDGSALLSVQISQSAADPKGLPVVSNKGEETGVVLTPPRHAVPELALPKKFDILADYSDNTDGSSLADDDDDASSDADDTTEAESAKATLKAPSAVGTQIQRERSPSMPLPLSSTPMGTKGKAPLVKTESLDSKKKRNKKKKGHGQNKRGGHTDSFDFPRPLDTEEPFRQNPQRENISVTNLDEYRIRFQACMLACRNFIVAAHTMALGCDKEIKWIVCFVFFFPELVLYTIGEYAPSWASVCLFYAFLIQILCTGEDARVAGIERKADWKVTILRKAIPLAFLLDGVSHPSLLLGFDRYELLITANLLSAIKCVHRLNPIVMATVASQVLFPLFARDLVCEIPLCHYTMLYVQALGGICGIMLAKLAN